jgi:acyl-CoA thioester hydrolase
MARFVHHVHMRWMDMDAFAHVNNSAYLAYLEECRIAMFFDRLDATFSQGTVIARHEIDYLRPIVYHQDALRLEGWVDRVRGASFTVHYEVFDGETLAATAASDCVTYDFGLNRPRRLTDQERALLVGFADDIRSAVDRSADGTRSGDGTR